MTNVCNNFGDFCSMLCLEVVLFHSRKQVKYIPQTHLLELTTIAGISASSESIIRKYFNLSYS